MMRASIERQSKNFALFTNSRHYGFSMSNSDTERLLVALSGGVDSAVSAALLKEQGHEIEGVYVRTWEHEDDVLGDCPGARDLADVAAQHHPLSRSGCASVKLLAQP